MTQSELLTIMVGGFATIAGVSSGMRFHTAVNKFCLNTILIVFIWYKIINYFKPKNSELSIPLINRVFFFVFFFNIQRLLKTTPTF